MMRNWNILFLILAIGLLAACGGTNAAGDPTAAPAATDTAVHSGDPTAGAPLYAQSCSACHGADATGVTGLGKDLTNSEFIRSNSDAELLIFVQTGRPAGDPDNSTGIDMPPKGGNPALSDVQIGDIIAYLRTLER